MTSLLPTTARALRLELARAQLVSKAFLAWTRFEAFWKVRSFTARR